LPEVFFKYGLFVAIKMIKIEKMAKKGQEMVEEIFGNQIMKIIIFVKSDLYIPCLRMFNNVSQPFLHYPVEKKSILF
jgi:hypothetical protein